MSATEPVRLRMEPEMTIYRAADLRSSLATAVVAMAAGTVLELDLADVAEIDCSGVQLLLSARCTVQARGAQLRLANHSAAVSEAFGLLDLGAVLGDGVTEAAAQKRSAA